MPRMLNRYNRIYIDGRDYSSAGASFGPLVYDPQEADMTAPFGDSAHGYLPDIPVVTPTVFNGVMDNTATTGLQTNLTGQAARNVMAVIGGTAAPAINAPCFCGIFTQTGYKATPTTRSMVTVSLTLGEWDEQATVGLNYRLPWGYLTHPMGAETAVDSANTSAAIVTADTALGGVMWYHVTSITGGTGVDIRCDDSEDGTTGWANISGCTVTVAQAAAPVAGFIGLATNATVRKYVRWQIVFNGGATACTFAQAFIRGNGA